MQPFVDPARKLRTALADCTSAHPTLDYFIRLAFRLPTDENGHRDYRNTDPQTRQTSLHLAALKGRTDVFEWFLEEGVDEGEVSRDAAGDTVVHIAAAKGHSEIADLYLNRYPFVVEWVNSRGMSPLHFACKEGHLEIAQLLIDVGADLDAPDLEGNTPLHYASAWGKIPLLRLLVDQDCQTDWRNNEGFTPAEFAFSFGVLRELEGAIKQHVDDLKDARRQARRDRRSKRAHLQEKRPGPASPLSILAPPVGVDVDGSGYAMGLGLSKQQSAESNDPDNHAGVPRLGQAISPTPQNGSPRYAVNSFRDQRPPLRQTADSPPSSPISSVFRYGNTTSPQPSPSASLASSAVPVVAEDRSSNPDSTTPALRSVSTQSSISAAAVGHNDAARSPSRITPVPTQAHVFQPPHRKHSSSFGAAGVALAPTFEPVRTEGADAPSLAPPVLALVPGLSSPAVTDFAQMPENWPPSAEPVLPPTPQPPPPAHHNKLVRKSRPSSSAVGRTSPPASPPQPVYGQFESNVQARSATAQPMPPAHHFAPVFDPASAYDPDVTPAAASGGVQSYIQQPLVSQQLAHHSVDHSPPASRPVIQHSQAMLPPGRNSVDGLRSVSGPAAVAQYDSHYPRASFETDGSARTSATGSSVIIPPYPVPRGPGAMHDPRRAVSLAQLQQQQQQQQQLRQQDRQPVRLVLPNAQSTTSLPVGPAGSSSGHAKLRKHRKGSHDLTRTTSASTGTGSVKSGGGRLARAFGFGKKS